MLAFPAVSSLQQPFLKILPRIEQHGRVYFRHQKCRHQQADNIAEMVALAWKWFTRLAERKKDASDFPTAIATFAARAVNAGRRICGKVKPNDVLSPLAQRSRHFTVSTLPHVSTLYGSVFDDALCDNTQTPVPDQVSFRCDFPAWLDSQSNRDRAIAAEMARGEKTFDLARRFKLSPARVSQLRRQFHESWERFIA